MAVSDFAKPRAQPAVRPCRVLDPKFAENAGRYALQCAVATASIFLVLTLLDAFRQTVLIAALGASSFVAFTMPHVTAARPRYLIGGYLIGIVVGCSVALLADQVAAAAVGRSLPIAFAAAATGIAIFLMVVTDTEHPPAAGLALGLVLNEWDLGTVAVVLAGIVGITALKEFCKPNMMNLL